MLPTQCFPPNTISYIHKWIPSTCRGQDKMAAICRQYFQIPFREYKFLCFNLDFTQTCSKLSHWQFDSIGSEYNLVVNKPDNYTLLVQKKNGVEQAIILNDGSVIYWHMYASFGHDELTHWGRVTHICVSKQTVIGSDNGLSPGRRQAIFWTNAGILLIGTLGTNFSEILIGIQIFSFKKIHLKMKSAKWRPFCLGLNVLVHAQLCCAFFWLYHQYVVGFVWCEQHQPWYNNETQISRLVCIFHVV